MREAKSIFDCRERECDERETNAICINEELLSSRGTEQAKASLIVECSKTRRFGPRRCRGGRRVVRCSNQYATECSCAVAPTWMERNQSNSTIQRRPKRMATAPRMPVAPVILSAPAALVSPPDLLPLLLPPEPLEVPSGLSEPVPSGLVSPAQVKTPLMTESSL